MWTSAWLCAFLLATGQDEAPPPVTAADAVTLRDGQVALGQVAEPAPRGKVVLVVRRAWAKRWEDVERTWAPRARKERLERLKAWRADLGAQTDRKARLSRWLESQIERLTSAPETADTALMAVQISKSDVRKVARKPPETGRWLRQGWLAGFREVETMPLDELKNALEGRGFALNGTDLAAVDELLPIMPEPEPLWQMRRAATEVVFDSNLRFIRYQMLVLPEGSPGAPAEGAALLSSLLKNLLGDQPQADPLAATLRQLGSRGHTGAVVTRLDLAAQLASVTVETTLWVRRGPDRWEPAVNRSATVRPEALGPAAGQELGEDPQVKAAFGVLDALGLGQAGDEARKRSLNMGAATQRALSLAREAIDRDLHTLALRVTKPKLEKPKGSRERSREDDGSRERLREDGGSRERLREDGGSRGAAQNAEPRQKSIGEAERSTPGAAEEAIPSQNQLRARGCEADGRFVGEPSFRQSLRGNGFERGARR